ncbi:MAG: riboflavin biosynthesis protein RibF [Bacteroidetes bacterium HGW-Bacteroidetes-2]|nr:MAG: riboflavin biosynthesis protein RibF [Bacteroidetes bacterium HGW-Bacteroidetes-2]
MKIHHSLANYHSDRPTVVTIGTFDGVHLGHKEILNKLISTAKKNNLDSVILTFFPHPRMVLQNDSTIKLINTIKEREAIFSKTPLNHLIIHPFTTQFSRLTALEFVRDILVHKLHAKKIIIGYDHRFGRNRNANIDDLRDFGKTYNFEVEEISAKEQDKVTISSTKIRKALKEGDMEKANSYLGYPFMLNGTIVRGKGLGKTINYPTANLHIEEEYKIIPKNGVYLVQSVLENKPTYGLMSIGTNPTVDGTTRTIETFFLETNSDLYNKKLQIELLAKIREEEKFDSLEALQMAIKGDEAFARDYLQKLHAK